MILLAAAPRIPRWSHRSWLRTDVAKQNRPSRCVLFCCVAFSQHRIRLQSMETRIKRAELSLRRSYRKKKSTRRCRSGLRVIPPYGLRLAAAKCPAARAARALETGAAAPSWPTRDDGGRATCCGEACRAVRWRWRNDTACEKFARACLALTGGRRERLRSRRALPPFGTEMS